MKKNSRSLLLDFSPHDLIISFTCWQATCITINMSTVTIIIILVVLLLFVGATADLVKANIEGVCDFTAAIEKRAGEIVSGAIEVANEMGGDLMC